MKGVVLSADLVVAGQGNKITIDLNPTWLIVFHHAGIEEN
jgi:hypothetical protein